MQFRPIERTVLVSPRSKGDRRICLRGVGLLISLSVSIVGKEGDPHLAVRAEKLMEVRWPPIVDALVKFYSII